VSRKLPVIYNPVAGRGRLLKRRPGLDRRAEELGVSLEWLATERPGHATELARDCAERGAPLVLAFGGDGTYNEAARGLLGGSTSLGLLPGGTSSVLAWELGVPRPAEEALGPLLAGGDRPLTVGRTDRDQIFLMMLSSGPDAVVLEHLSPALKLRGGKAGIAVQAVAEFARGRLPRIAVSDGRWRASGGWVIVGNIRCYGGPFQATPGADPFSPHLEVVVQTSVGRVRAVPFFFAIALGRHLRRRDVVRRRVEALRIEPAGGSGPVPYQLDGDPAGTLPVEVRLDHRRLLVRLPGGAQAPGSSRSAVEM